MSFLPTFISWFTVLVFLVPLSWFGLVVIRRIVRIRRLEVLIPSSLIFGIASYIFFLNLFSYLVKPPLSILLTYVFLIFLSFVLARKKVKESIDFPRGKSLAILIFSTFFWAIFLIFYIGEQVGFGGDVSLYYSIAETFTRGNFPVMSPWQPDLSVGYHYGASIFLGVLNFATNLPFDFLHRLSAFLLILSSSQLLVYFRKRHKSFVSLLIYQIPPLTFFVLVGTFMIVTPIFPISLPKINSFAEFLLWASRLPSVHISFETWGGPVTLGLTVYFLHQFTSLAMFVLLLPLVFFKHKERKILNYLAIVIILSALALTNEVVFVPAIALVFGTILLQEIRNGLTRKKIFLFLITVLLTALFVAMQGGIITEVIFNKNLQLENSVVIFPKKSDILNDFSLYHINQQNSKSFPIQDDWLPLRYFHIGFNWLYPLTFFFLFVLIRNRLKKESLLFFALVLSAIVATLSYNFIVPKFKVADGNRLMVLAYQFLGLAFSFWFIWVAERLWRQRKKLMFLFIIFITLWVFGFSSLQPFAELKSYTLSYNHLKSAVESTSESVKWMRNNVPYDARILNLDASSPFSSNPGELLTKAGVFVPTFDSTYRTYSLEGSPEYNDLVYTMNPSLMKKFGISHVLVNAEGFEKLPNIRKIDLANKHFFQLIYENDANVWEKIYKVKEEYVNLASSLGGTFEELGLLIPSDSKIFIGDWEDVAPWNVVRKSVIFSLKDRNIIYVWGPGVYLNVLTNINGRPPQIGEKFDYLVLPVGENPNKICNCRTRLIWSGINSSVELWEVIP